MSKTKQPSVLAWLNREVRETETVLSILLGGQVDCEVGGKGVQEQTDAELEHDDNAGEKGQPPASEPSQPAYCEFTSLIRPAYTELVLDNLADSTSCGRGTSLPMKLSAHLTQAGVEKAASEFLTSLGKQFLFIVHLCTEHTF